MASPYRSPLPLEPRPEAPTEFFYAPRTTPILSQGFVPIVLGVVLGGIGGAITDHMLASVGVCSVVSVLAAVLQRRTGDAAGILFRAGKHTLTLTRGRRGPVFVSVAFEDVLDVKIDTETMLVAPGNFVTGPGFGVHRTGSEGGTVDQSRNVLLVRDRKEPVYLTTERVSNMDAVEWLARIRRFLRAHGWMPLEERGDMHASAEALPEPTELLAVRTDEDHYTLSAVVRRFELVLQWRDRPASTSTYIIGPEELPVFTESLLKGSCERRRYEELEHDEMVFALVHDLFVEPYGRSAMDEVKQWLDDHEIPYCMRDA